MKKIFENSINLLIDLTWVILFAIVTSASLFITSRFSILLSFMNVYVKYSLLALIFVNVYIITTGIMCRLLTQKVESGHSKIGLNKKWINWRLNWHFYSLVFLFFSKFVFYNRTSRYLFLRLMRVNVKYTTYFAETVDMQDCNNLLTIGANSGLGSEVLIATHLALSTDVIVYRPVTIGENSHIQARASIAPGVTVGNNCIVGFGTTISIGVKIGDGTKIGGECIINTGVTIGCNCKIGDNVKISPKVKVPDNTTIPDNAVIRESSVILPDTVIA